MPARRQAPAVAPPDPDPSAAAEIPPFIQSAPAAPGAGAAPVPMFPQVSPVPRSSSVDPGINPPTRRMNLLNVPGHLQVRVSQNPTLLRVYGVVAMLLLIGLLLVIKIGLDQFNELRLTLQYGPVPRMSQGDVVLGLAEETVTTTGTSHWIAFNHNSVGGLLVIPGDDASKGFVLPFGFQDTSTPPQLSVVGDQDADGIPDLLYVTVGTSDVFFIRDPDPTKTGAAAWHVPTAAELPHLRSLIKFPAGGQR